MNKWEYLDRLTELLACLPPDHRIESVSFYAEMIDDRMEDGMTEEEAVAALDPPGVAAEAILDELPAVPRVVAKTRRKSRALLWTAVIVGSPIWLSLAAAFLVTAVAIYACIWLLAACIWLLAIGLVLGAPIGVFLFAVGIMVGNVPFSVAELGAGLFSGAIGVLCLRGAYVASKQLARLSRVWVAKAVSPFVKRKKGASDDGGAGDGGSSPESGAKGSTNGFADGERGSAGIEPARAKALASGRKMLPGSASLA